MRTAIFPDFLERLWVAVNPNSVMSCTEVSLMRTARCFVGTTSNWRFKSTIKKLSHLFAPQSPGISTFLMNQKAQMCFEQGTKRGNENTSSQIQVFLFYVTGQKMVSLMQIYGPRASSYINESWIQSRSLNYEALTYALTLQLLRVTWSIKNDQR